VAGSTAQAAVRRLRDEHVIASVTPYAERHVRVTPSVRNSPEEVDRVLEVVRSFG
jgi:selenocysteine lyase/cysteine desulfurase